MRLSDEGEHSDEAFVAGITSKSYIAVHTEENATLCAEEMPARIRTMS